MENKDALYKQAFESLKKDSLIRSYELEKKRMLEIIEGRLDADMKELLQSQINPLLIHYLLTVPLMQEEPNPAMAARCKVIQMMVKDLENQKIRIGILIRIDYMHEKISLEEEEYLSKNISRILMKSFELVDEKISTVEDIVSLMLQVDSGNIRYDSRKEAVAWVLDEYRKQRGENDGR